MTEKPIAPEIDKFSAFVGGLKRAVVRSKKEGRPTVETPAVDNFLEREQVAAGSKPRTERTE